MLYAPLREIDPVVQNIIDKETWRQFTGLELIASEVRLAKGEGAQQRVLNVLCWFAEPHQSCDDGGERLDPHEQVL